MTTRVLLVEDESMVLMLLEDLIAGMGYEVGCSVANVEDALVALEKNEIDVALVDVNLGGTPSFPIADALAARGIPFVFTTGYGARGLPPEYANFPVLQKPFRPRDLQAALMALQSPQGTQAS